MYQTSRTIKETLDQIRDESLVLPAIQREFVWQPEQIYRFFDSLMQDYPFGTFLYWQVSAENVDKFQFYKFMRDYHELDNRHCAPIEDTPKEALTAILDGQQRLTALNIGLRGTMAWKMPNKWWRNPNAFPKRKLYLDLLGDDKPDENGIRYRFAFLTDEQLGQKNEGHYWLSVKSALEYDAPTDLLDEITARLEKDKISEAFKTFNTLFNLVHEHKLITFYEERGQELEKVLNIFIRMNSGGTALSYSDLLLSIAVAQWDKHDAREEIHTLVNDMNRIGDGFDFSKDLVLKAGLMLSDIGNVGFKVENFNKDNMAKLESNWISIRDTLLLTVQLISSFGFNAKTIRADSAILPIAYYLHKRKPGESYLTRSSNEADRKNIREWFIKSLLKASGIWGSGLDTLLTALRGTIQKHGTRCFPYSEIQEIMTRRGKPISFEPEEIEELTDMSYGDKRLFSLMSLIFSFTRTQYNFHIDHIFPKGRFTPSNLRKAGLDSDEIDQAREDSNKIANLQLLLGPENNEKRKKMPLEWIEKTFPDQGERQQHVQAHLLDGLSNDLAEFPAFYKQRRDVIKMKITEVLNVRD